MKLITQLAIGVGCGALAALGYHAITSDRSIASSAESFRILPVSRPDTISDRAPQRSNFVRSVDQPTVTRFAATNGLPAEIRQAYESVSEWAFFDPAGFFVFAQEAESIDSLIAGLEVLIATDPARVFEITGRFRGTGSTEVDDLYLHAIRGMVGRDPIGAIARLQGVAVGTQRDPILAAIGEAYALIDPDAALQWAVSVMPPSPDAIDGVLESVAATDLLHAYDLMQQAQDRIASAQTLGFALARAAVARGLASAPVATALAERREPDADIVLQGLLQGWMLQDPESVIAWMNTNEAYLTDELTRAAVYYLAFNDVTYAAELTERVPASAQQQWLDEVANRYGQFDIEAALNWLPQFEGRTGYTEILNRTLLGAATLSRSLPQVGVVARFIETTDANVSYEAVMRTGYSYADLDPEAAAQWALGLNDPEYAGWAAAAVVDGWGGDDGPAAQSWALEQPRGALRDEMLGSLLSGGVFYEGLDRRALVEAFTSPAAAQESIHMFILRDVVNRREVTDESRAQVEWMLDRLTDPELKRQAEEQIAQFW